MKKVEIKKQSSRKTPTPPRIASFWKGLAHVWQLRYKSLIRLSQEARQSGEHQNATVNLMEGLNVLTFDQVPNRDLLKWCWQTWFATDPATQLSEQLMG